MYTKPRSISNEQLIEAVIKSHSMYDLLRRLNVKIGGGTILYFKTRISQSNLDISHFKSRVEINKELQLYVKPNVLCYHNGHRRLSTPTLRKAMLDNGIVYSCSICNINNWMNKNIIFEIDHIDGNWKNNDIKNLRFLCPNCHSQTETYKGRNKKHKDKRNIIEKDELEKMLETNTLTELAKHFDVTTMTIKNYLNKYKLDKKKNKKNRNISGKNCIGCGVRILQSKKRCEECNNIYKSNGGYLLKQPVDKNVLHQKRIIEKKSYQKIGSELGFAWQTIKKWCELYSIE